MPDDPQIHKQPLNLTDIIHLRMAIQQFTPQTDRTKEMLTKLDDHLHTIITNIHTEVHIQPKDTFQ